MSNVGLNGALVAHDPQQMPSLTHLNLTYNQLSGTFPRFRGNSLQQLYLSSNRITGPVNIRELPSLTSFFINDNLCTGLPPDPVVQTTLEHYVIARNEFSGFLPSSLSQATNLIQLDVSGNKLSGVVPPLPSNILACDLTSVWTVPHDNIFLGACPSNIICICDIDSSISPTSAVFRPTPTPFRAPTPLMAGSTAPSTVDPDTLNLIPTPAPIIGNAPTPYVYPTPFPTQEFDTRRTLISINKQRTREDPFPIWIVAVVVVGVLLICACCAVVCFCLVRKRRGGQSLPAHMTAHPLAGPASNVDLQPQPSDSDSYVTAQNPALAGRASKDEPFYAQGSFGGPPDEATYAKLMGQSATPDDGSYFQFSGSTAQSSDTHYAAGSFGAVY